MISRAQVTLASGSALALRGNVRAADTYERFSNAEKRYTRCDLGAAREMVRSGLRTGSVAIVRDRGTIRATVNTAGDCAAPVVAHLRSVPLPLPGSYFPAGVRAYLVTVLRRCRQCEWCRTMRSAHWSHRARTEYEKAACTWLGTITLSPMQHQRIDAAVAAKARQSGAYWLTEWTSKDMFRERCEIMGGFIRKWINRFRQAEVRRRRLEAMRHVFVYARKRGKKTTRIAYARFCVVRADFRYLLVAEEHRSERTATAMVGRPHYHILVHEARQYELVRPHEYYVTQKGVVRVADAAMIRRNWQLGFTQFELCRDARSASYLCKYLSKDMLWRVRASIAYGQEESSDRREERATADAERERKWTSLNKFQRFQEKTTSL